MARSASPFPARSGALAPRGIDLRDWILDARARPTLVNMLAPEVLLPSPGPPRDQDNVPCCVSTAICACMETLDAVQSPATFRRLSSLFHYYVAREPAIASFRGLHIADALSLATVTGICLDTHHPEGAPLLRERAIKRPTQAARSNARDQALFSDRDRRILGYRNLELGDRVANWKVALGTQRPVLASFYMTDGYLSLKTERNDTLAWPQTGRFANLHAVAVIGYSEARAPPAFRIKDSRGSEFGDQGYWWLPYAAAERLVKESYCIERLNYD